MIIVTGGCGFIGANFILDWLRQSDEPIINVDKLTYAGNPATLASLQGDARYHFVQGDIGDSALFDRLLMQNPRAVINFAAESHVDRSIHGPADFIETNVSGTFRLLESVRAHWQGLDDAAKSAFRFLHVSTDEVYGTLTDTDPAFSETTPYAPNSPYSASKAASDHLVRAWHHTYGLPVLTTNCSNNYGPYQFPEKLIPLLINNAKHHKTLPVYGDGMQIRDWLYVMDHCKAIDMVANGGKDGEVYNVGGHNERPNIFIVKTVIEQLHDRLKDEGISEELIKHVADRLGHDRRYGIDPTKIKNDLGWYPETPFEKGIVLTIDWYLAHEEWMDHVTSGNYQKYYEQMYKNK